MVRLSCSVDRYARLSNDLLTCHQVSFTHFPLWSSDPGEWLFRCPERPRACQRLACWVPAGLVEKRCAPSLLCDTEGRRARGRYGEECGVRVGVKAHNNGPSQARRAHQLSVFSCNLRKWNLVKLVSSWVPIAWVMWLRKGYDRGGMGSDMRWGSTAATDSFSSLEKGEKLIAVLHGSIPGQSGCLHGNEGGSAVRGWD